MRDNVHPTPPYKRCGGWSGDEDAVRDYVPCEAAGVSASQARAHTSGTSGRTTA